MAAKILYTYSLFHAETAVVSGLDGRWEDVWQDWSEYGQRSSFEQNIIYDILLFKQFYVNNTDEMRKFILTRGVDAGLAQAKAKAAETIRARKTVQRIQRLNILAGFNGPELCFENLCYNSINRRTSLFT